MADLPDDQERRMQLAIEAIRTKAILSVRRASITFNVPRSTLQDRLAGKRVPNRYSKTGLQKLSVEEEDFITREMTRLHNTGHRPTIKTLEQLAAQLLAGKGLRAPLGKNWHARFLTRHPEVKEVLSRSGRGERAVGGAAESSRSAAAPARQPTAAAAARTGPPSATLTDRFGRKVEVPVDREAGKAINAIVERLFRSWSASLNEEGGAHEGAAPPPPPPPPPPPQQQQSLSGIPNGSTGT
ncbi:hypothetical protein VTK56DRAFT_380 [Thermocarpiscus australiensis]